MAISRARKEELVAQYVELINQSEAVFLTNYTGLDVKAMETLRDEINQTNGAFHVTKNSLLRRALQQTNKPVPKELLQGQVAAGFALEGVPTLAKALVNYAEEEEFLSIKGGILGEEFLSVEEIESLAKLPTLDQLRAQIIGLIGTPAQNIVSTVTNGVRQVVNVIDAYAKSEETADAEAA